MTRTTQIHQNGNQEHQNDRSRQPQLHAAERSQQESRPDHNAQAAQHAEAKGGSQSAQRAKAGSSGNEIGKVFEQELASHFEKPAAQLDKLATALRGNGEGKGPMATSLSKTADGVEAAATRLRDLKPEDVLRAIGAFAKRNPMTFVGAAMVIGIGSGQLLRGSSTASAA